MERKFISVLRLLIAAIIIPTTIFSAELNFNATVDRTTVGLGETFTLNVLVSGENIGNVPSPKLPDMPDFNILGRSSSQSTNISFINGKMTQQSSINYIYTISPKRIGKLVIGSCKIDYQGKTYETQPIEIEVVKGATQTVPQVSTQPPGTGTVGEGGIMLLAVPSRTEVYQGEQINVDFYLYTQYNIDNANLTKVPKLSGFWSETIYDADRLSYQKKVYEGKTYYVALIKTIALFPITSGNLSIDPMEINITVIKPPRDFFDFFGTAQTVNISSRAVAISVKPLPKDHQPEEFCGAVGKFTLEARVDRDTSRQGEPVNFTLKISGTGNTKLIEKPKIPPIQNLRVLEPEVKESIEKSTGTIKGTKEFRFPLIPQTDGEHIIPEIKVAYFNPKTKNYEILTAPKQRFIASGVTQGTAAITDAGGLKILGSDIKYIKQDKNSITPQSFDIPRTLIIIYPCAIILFGLALLYHHHQTKLSVDRAYARRFWSNKIFRKKFQEAATYLKEQNQKNFYSALSHAILNYLGDRFNLNTGALTTEQLKIALKEKGAKTEIIEQLFDIIQKCEAIAYSPIAKTDDSMTLLFEKTKQLIKEL